MNNDLTVSALAFKWVSSEKVLGSLRREISRGVNLPTELKIVHQDYVDSKYKFTGRRHVVRFDRYLALSSGIIAPASIYTVAAIPTDTGVVTADITALCAQLNNFLFAATGNTSGLDLCDEAFASQEQ